MTNLTDSEKLIYAKSLAEEAGSLRNEELTPAISQDLWTADSYQTHYCMRSEQAYQIVSEVDEKLAEEVDSYMRFGEANGASELLEENVNRYREIAEVSTDA